MSTKYPATLLIALSAALGTACSTARAAVPLERPALEVPPPPPRIIVPLPPSEAPLPEPVPELPSEPSAGSPARARPQSKPEPAKTEAKPETAPPTDPQPAQQAAPPPQLRTPDGGNAQLAHQIRETIGRVTAMLDRIDPNTLSEPRKKAHTDARLFNRQADDSLKSGNLVYAREMADKAERLAKELQSR